MAVRTSVSPRPVIVVTNDDGIHAAGLQCLGRALASVGDVYVVAPETEQSSTSHAITLSRPLRLRAVRPQWYALDGTPVDCVYVALHHAGLLPRPATLVVSGINHGLNLGSDVYYSGTVAGAREGALRGVPAVAFSTPGGGDFTACGRRARSVVARLLAWRAAHPDAPAPLLNVNFPAGVVRGLRATVLGDRVYDDAVEVRRDPRGRQYLWLGGKGVHHPEVPDSDTAAYEEGYGSVTPLRMDLVEPSQRALAEGIAGRRRDPGQRPSRRGVVQRERSKP